MDNKEVEEGIKEKERVPMTREELIEKIRDKKEFSKLPIRDVEEALNKFEGKRLADFQKVKLSRQFLRKVYSSFSSRKLLSPKEKDVDWIMRKHKSTLERLPHYEEIYGKIFESYKGKKVSVVDLGAGVNGFSYGYLEKAGIKPEYIAVEAVGQLVDLMNEHFEREKINKKAKAVHESLFNIKSIKNVIEKTSNPRVIFLFKVIDSLEIVKRDYSKELIKEIAPLADKIVLSYATRSLGRRQKFGAQRSWIKRFILENYDLEENYDLGGEEYIIFREKKSK